MPQNMPQKRNILNLCIGLLFFVSSIKAQNIFIENKGQFPNQVNAKVNLPSGSLFIEQGVLVYAFYSASQLASVHDLTTKKQADRRPFL